MQAINIDEPSPQLANARFWDPEIAAVWFSLAFAASVLLAFQPMEIQGLIVAALALYCLQAAFSALPGKHVSADLVTIPRAIFNFWPAFILGRTSFETMTLQRITAAGTFLSMDVVALTTLERSHRVIFVTRDQRLAFFDAIKRHNPDVRVYRAT